MSCAIGLKRGPAATRAMNPYAIGSISHGKSSAIVSAAIMTTPAATPRATLEFIGFGKLKNGLLAAPALVADVIGLSSVFCISKTKPPAQCGPGAKQYRPVLRV
jgi:hypothetical protein